MPILEIEGRRVEVGDEFLGLYPEEQNRVVEDIRSSFGDTNQHPTDAAPAPEQEQPPVTHNPLAGAWQSAKEIGGNLLGAINRGADYLESKIPLGSIGSGENVVKAGEKALLNSAAQTNYQPAEDASWEGLKAKVTAGDLPGAAENLVKFGANVGITSLPSMISALGPGIVPYILSQTEGNLKARQANNNGAPVTTSDVAASLGAALGEGFLERFGAGKAVGGVVKQASESALKGAAKRTGEAVLTEGATEAVQNPLQYAAQTVGTEKGFDPATAADAAAQGFVGGAAAGGMLRGTKEGAGLARDVAREPLVRAQVRRAQADPEGFAAEVRAIQNIEADKQQVVRDRGPQEEFSLARTNWNDIRGGFERTVKSLYAAGDLSQSERDGLISDYDNLLRTAGTHTSDLREMDLQKIDSLENVTPEAKKTLRAAAVDMNLLAQQGKAMKQIGPIESTAKAINGPLGRLSAAAMGYHLGGVPGALGGVALDFAGQKIGRGLDNVLGLQRPEALRGSRAKLAAAKRLGMEVTDTRQDLAAINADATKRAERVVILPRDYLRRREQAQLGLAARQKAVAAAKLQKEHEALMAKTEKAIADMEAQAKAAGVPDIHDPRVLSQAKKGTLAFMLRQAMLAKKAQAKEADRLSRETQQAEAEAAKAAEHVRYIEALEKGEGDVPLGGWKASAIEEASKNLGAQVTMGDLADALQQLTAEGVFKPEEAKAAWVIPGAKIGQSATIGKPYYRLQDRAAQLAAKRLGIELNLEGAMVNRKKAERKGQVERLVDRQLARAQAEALLAVKEDEASRQVDAARKLLLARTLSPEHLQAAITKAETPRAPRKPKEAPPVAPAPEVQPEAPPAPKGRQRAAKVPAAGIRNLPAYEATTKLAEDVGERLLKEAPPELVGIVAAVGKAKKKAEKKAIVDAAIAAYPQYAQWIEDHLRAYSEIGGAKDPVARLKRKKAAAAASE